MTENVNFKSAEKVNIETKNFIKTKEFSINLQPTLPAEDSPPKTKPVEEKEKDLKLENLNISNSMSLTLSQNLEQQIDDDTPMAIEGTELNFDSINNPMDMGFIDHFEDQEGDLSNYPNF